MGIWFLLASTPQDFANQVYWWRDYAAQCRANGVPKGIYCRPETAEYMSGLVQIQAWYECELLPFSAPGLPIGWTSPSPGTVKDKLEVIFPWLAANFKE